MGEKDWVTTFNKKYNSPYLVHALHTIKCYSL